MRKALVVGINAYPPPNELSGCVSDARAWEAYLKTRKFEVNWLHDSYATRAGIVEELRLLMDGAKPGDVLAFVYSGHGTYVPDIGGDEDDARDEAIVPVDFQQGQLLIDDDLRLIFDQVPAGVALTCFLDSCYSGTATRLLGINAPRIGEKPRRSRYLVLNREERAAYLNARTATPTLVRPLLSPEQMRHATISACTPQEVAWETDGQGVFTRTALGVLSRSGATLTLGGFLNRVLLELGADRWQTPTLDGPEYMRRQTLVRKAR